MRALAPRPAFSLLEVLVSLAIVAVLIAILLPLLLHAREASYRTVCQSNLRQTGIGWQGYLHEHERFPSAPEDPEWKYGGVTFVGSERLPVVDAARPINRYIVDDADREDPRAGGLFRCPSDRGARTRDEIRPGAPLPPGAFEDSSYFARYGVSYRSNPYLVGRARSPWLEPIRVGDIRVSTSRLLLAGDPEWYLATLPADHPEHELDASWHQVEGAGNMLAVDGSVRFMRFREELGRSFNLLPWGDQPPAD